MITIIFGEMGSGKTFAGLQLSKQTGEHYFDGDDWLPTDLYNKINKGGLITKSEADRFIKTNFISGLEATKQVMRGTNFIISQALYNEAHRQFIADHYDCEFILIKTPFFQHIRQLFSRPNKWRWIFNMLVSKPWFNRPKVPHKIVLNQYNP